MENIAEKVNKIFMECLFMDEEIAQMRKEGLAQPKDAVIVEGITQNFGLHPVRLEACRDLVKEIIEEMPTEFRKTKGGGWSFLNLCNDKNGVQWADLHRTMEQLVVLAVGRSVF
jgi:hypothetical protein